MSTYTTQVRFICETASGLTEQAGFNDVNKVIQSAIPNVFNFDFPIYDESYRNVLCTKILKHYYTREIGGETVGIWKLWLDTKLNEIMPYYNQLYKSAIIEFNPMYDIDITTKHTKGNNDTTNVNGNVTSNSTSNNSETERDLFSDTPQGSLNNVENETYLTTARKITTSGTASSNNSSAHTGKTIASSTEEYVQNISGKSGGTSYSKRLKEFRETFINIDAMIIDELSDLFINLW